MKSPILFSKITQNAEFSVVTPEQSKLIIPVDTAILSLIPKGDLDLSTYLNKFLRTKKPEEQNNTFRFPTPENSGKTEDHTSKQSRILREFYLIWI